MKHKPVRVSELIGKRRVCDRCGEGTYMAEHEDRYYCGKCKLTIWKKKS